jgi:hypothetical protein
MRSRSAGDGFRPKLGVPFVFVTGCDLRAFPAEFEPVERLGKPAPPGLIVQAVGRSLAAR